MSERPRTTVPVVYYCVPVAGVDSWRYLRSATCQLLAVPRYRLNTYGRRVFSVAGPTVWNSLPNFTRNPTISSDCFRRLLKTYLFARYYSAFSALEVLTTTALYKFTYLLADVSTSHKPVLNTALRTSYRGEGNQRPIY